MPLQKAPFPPMHDPWFVVTDGTKFRRPPRSRSVGRSAMSSPLNTYCTFAFWMSTAGDSATTLTVSEMLPTASCTLTRSEEHTSELQSLRHLVCRLLLEKKNKKTREDQ